MGTLQIIALLLGWLMKKWILCGCLFAIFSHIDARRGRLITADDQDIMDLISLRGNFAAIFERKKITNNEEKISFFASVLDKSGQVAVSRYQDVIDYLKKEKFLPSATDIEVKTLQTELRDSFARILAQHLVYDEKKNGQPSGFLISFSENAAELENLSLSPYLQNILTQKIVAFLQKGNLVYQKNCPVSFCAFHPNASKLIFVCQNQLYQVELSIKESEVNTSKKLINLRRATISAFALTSRNNKLQVAVGYEDGIIEIIDLESSKSFFLRALGIDPWLERVQDSQGKLERGIKPITAVAFDDNYGTLYAAVAGYFYAYNLSDFKLIKMSVEHPAEEPVYPIIVTPNAILTGCRDGYVRSFSLQKLEPGVSWNFGSPITALSVTDSVGALVGLANRKAFDISDINKGLSQLFGQYSSLKNVQLIDKGATVVITTDKEVIFYKRDTKEELRRYIDGKSLPLTNSLYSPVRDFLAVTTGQSLQVHDLLLARKKIKNVGIDEASIEQALFLTMLAFKGSLNLDLPENKNLRKIFLSLPYALRKSFRDDKLVQATLGWREYFFDGPFANKLYEYFVTRSGQLAQ
jgi:hypothetical protein